MEDLRTYTFNIAAILISGLESINPYLQTLVLISTFVYTLQRIIKNIKSESDK
jgi:hypothetical protein